MGNTSVSLGTLFNSCDTATYLCSASGSVSEMSKISFLTDDLVAQNDFIVFGHNENFRFY